MFGYDWPHWHALLNDAPSALLVVAVLFDLAGLVTRRSSLLAAGFWTLIAGAVGAGLAVISGLQAEDRIVHGSGVHEIMEHHEELALITLGIFGVLALWRIARNSRMGNGERIAALLVSFAGVGVLIATARQGGRLIFEHAAGVPSAVLQNELKERAAGHHHHGGDEDADHDHAGSVDTAPHQHDDGADDHDHDHGGDTTAPHP